jgi:ABC transport system ATP-binding/permease protein
MNALIVKELEKSYADRQILRGCNLNVGHSERVGIVGANGAGKSTLLRLITGQEHYDSGSIVVQGSVSILDQNPVLLGDTVEDAIHEASAWHHQMLTAYQTAVEQEDWDEMDELHAQLDIVGWDVSHNTKAMLDRVKAPSKERKLNSLSGGEIRRVAMAKALLRNADLLILDEPTNHLDAQTIEWLEAYLSGYRGAVLLVTHDRYLLEAVATKIIEVEDGLCVGYDGSYGDYLVASAERQSKLRRSEERRLKLIAKEAEWAARSPAARSTKQKARLQRLEHLREQRRLPNEREMAMNFETNDKFGSTLLELEGISLQYDNVSIFQDINLTVRPKQRVGILGANGVGKSSLLRIICGEQQPSAGTILRQSRLNIGLLDQQRTGLKEDDSVFEAAGGGADYVTFGSQKMHVAGFLNRFLFPREMLEQKVELLSGGERARLLMAKLMLGGANILLLDEPTNDLDLLTLRALEDSLLSFGGGVIVVTHDRAFLDRVCNSVLQFQEGTAVTYSDRHQANENLKTLTVASEAKIKKNSTRQKSSNTNKLSYKERQELDAIPDELEKLECRQTEITDILGDSKSYSDTNINIGTLQEELQNLETIIENKMERWEMLSERE